MSAKIRHLEVLYKNSLYARLFNRLYCPSQSDSRIIDEVMSHFKNTVTDWFSFFSLSLDKNAKKIFSKKIRFITASSNKKDMASNFKTEIKRKPLVEVKLEAGFHGPPGPGTDRSELVRDFF